MRSRLARLPLRRRDSIPAPSIPVVFAVATVLAYGLVLPFTGFYWDDWPFAWLAKFMGPADFIPAFRGFRPFLGPIFYVTTTLIPAIPLLWQIFALLIRFASGLAAWFALSQVWPAHKRQVLIASLLFLVFPGYSQHWVALTHINQEWIPLTFYLLSFGFTARALRWRFAEAAGAAEETPAPADPAEPAPRRPGIFQRIQLKGYRTNTVLALLLLVAGVFPTEYFIGLEPLRFLFMWVMLSETTERFWPRVLETLKHWWPYLLIWLADAAWLAYYYKSGAYVSYDLTAVQSAPRLSEALLAFGDALWKAGLYVWVQVLVLCARAISTPTSLSTLGLIVLAFLLATVYLLRLAPAHFDTRAFAVPAVVIGLIGIVLGRVPSFAAGLPLTLQSSYDRFMISMMPGASLFAVGLVELLLRNVRLKTAIFALLIALGIGQQFFNANIFRRDWVRQQQIYWQMAWRMPALKPGTALITQQMPLDYETDFSMTAALNWIYAPQLKPDMLPYALVYSEKRLGGIVLPSLKPDTVMRFPYRTTEFTGNTSQAVAIYVPPDGCLRVLDPTLGDQQTYAKLPDSLTGPIAISDPSRILIDAPALTLPSVPFGKEPQHGWCFFYEKAELARQAHNWQKIVNLAAQANLGGLAPQDALEWLPFIEGYARAGDEQSASNLTRKAWDADPRAHRGLCVLWKRLEQAGAPTEHAATGILGQFGCGQ